MRSKLAPPRLRQPYLPREALAARLARGLETRFTMVQAGAGYGKSTTLAAFLQTRPEPAAWYALDDGDADPLIFMAHLIAAADYLAPGLAATLQAQQAQAQQGDLPWEFVVDAFNNHLFEALSTDAWLVLDDLHLVATAAPPMPALLDRVLAYAPPNLHFLLTTRHWLDLPSLTRARARRDLILLEERDLAFSLQEIDALFRRQYGISLSAEQLRRLGDESEGWVMALQLLAQRLRNLSVAQVDAALADLPRHLDALFDYLTESVIRRQSAAVQAFLYQTAILRELDPAACDAVRRSGDSKRILAQVADAGLGLVQTHDRVYRHHHLVHEFLQRALSRDKTTWRTLHRRAAAHYAQSGSPELSIHHLIQAGDFEAAAHQLTAIAPAMLQAGRFRTLAAWLAQFPALLLDDQPDLRMVQGDVARLTSRYEDARAAYQRAESVYQARNDRLGQSRARRGQALIYIDTVRPAQAEALLKQALRALKRSHPEESARLLRLLAENATNRGRPALAARWYAAAIRLGARPDVQLEARIALRSGRLADMERLLAGERGKIDGKRPARTHREPSLLLSLLHALRGEAAAARQEAQTGLDLAHRLQSPFTKAVAHMRLGHAWQLPPFADLRRAQEHYEEAIRLTRALAIQRGEAEPQFGLALLYAAGGDVRAGIEAGRRSLELAQRAGDAWVGGLARLAMGVAYCRAQDANTARDCLQQALADLETCEDRFGVTLTHLWLAWLAHSCQRPREFAFHASRWLAASEDYAFLLTRPTLFGPREPQQWVPLLIRARNEGIETETVERLMARMGLPPALDYHPGYALRIQTLGEFRVWRGETEVSKREWGRKKARHLLQLLLIHRDRFLHREQIIEQLWPD
ncbi:MAG: hypothetical protein GXP42_08975, partial [Chloroflexi bacterium]|nr:hypothetical protein [Chloroflexota bacterium]